MRAYLRLDPQLADKKATYPDGAHRAFTDTLCFAEQQPHRGRFRNRRLLAVLLEKRARWIDYLITHEDLIPQKDGSLYVDGWDEWQEGDWKVAERVARIRNRRTVTQTVTDTVTQTVTPTVSTPLGGKRLAVSGKPLPAEAAARDDAPPAMGFQPPKRPPRPMASLASVIDQHNHDWDLCATCGQRRGGAAHAPGRADHPFQEGRKP